ncbi:helix-turn-helix domain-containing protein [Myroides guanonis]|uniref:AraC-type DNA-binding protein n=1 Tax=Myroides guanonis TaxID=1150112 RepID=A0A1I3UYL1_9FLAO|nr:AraC family transcriptional regulator [Myroides guanonis]SFJ87970.1 AraC-type DNA-binding protein [Myroides guanonis]
MRKLLGLFLIMSKMKVNILFFLIVFLTSHTLCSKESIDKFDSIFRKVVVELTGSQPDYAIHVADSLYKNSSSETLKMRSLMLSANIYQEINDRKNALKLSKRALELARTKKDIEWQARILGFISTQYRNIGLIEEGEKYILESVLAIEKIEDLVKRNLYRVLLLQEKAYYAFAKKNYNIGLEYLEESDKVFDLIPISSNHGYHRAISEELRGRLYLEKKDFLNAENAFLKAKNFLDPYNNFTYPLYGYIYTGLGKTAFENKYTTEKVKDYYNQALSLAESGFNSNLKLFLYGNLVEFFKNTGDWEKYGEFNEKLRLEQKTTSSYKNETINQLFDENVFEKTLLEEHYKLYLTIGLGVLSILLLIFYLYRIRELKNKRKYVLTLKYFEENKLRSKEIIGGVIAREEVLLSSPSILKEQKCNDFKISSQTEKRILRRIEEFEERLLFLESSVSISFLASFCDTNIRYISKILRDEKEQDFSSYINTLRIFYVIQKLKENKEYRSYKISYLAEISGFSSHSKFSSVFKQVVGLSPSEFIDLHNKFEVTDN